MKKHLLFLQREVFVENQKKNSLHDKHSEQDQAVVTTIIVCIILTLLFYFLFGFVESGLEELEESLSGHLFDADVLPSVYHRLSKVDQPDSMLTDILDLPISTTEALQKGNKEPPPKESILRAPTLREVRKDYESSPLLDLARPWGHVYKRNRIGCMVPTVYPDKEKQWKAIAATWGPLCDVLYWVCEDSHSPPDEMYGGKVLKIKMDRSGKADERNIWEKVWRYWLHVGSTRLIYEAEWWLKIDDDTFFSPVNFKGVTRYLDPDHPYALGHTILWRWHDQNIVFNSGACYALSRGALFALKPVFETMKSTDPTVGGMHCVDRSGAGEDPTMGVCLRQVGINPLNTLDENLKNRFLTFRVTDHAKSMWSHDPRDGDSYYWKHRPKYMGDTEIGCCSPYLISSHGYKGGDVFPRFKELHEIYNKPKNWDDLPLPPRPRWFLYDQQSVDFRIDEYRNSIDQIPNGQRIYAGPEHENWCYRCKDDDLFWINEFDKHRKGQKLILGGDINAHHEE